MLKIASNITSNNYQSKYSYQPSFKSQHVTVAELRQELQNAAKLDKRVSDLISQTRILINEARAKAKKKGRYFEEPRFITESLRDGKITLRPMANSRSNGFMLELEKDTTIDKILIDKNITDSIRLERLKKTCHGSALTKRYDVVNGKDKELNTSVKETIEKYLTHFLKENERSKAINGYIVV